MALHKRLIAVNVLAWHYRNKEPENKKERTEIKNA
jgi:hypothetical protein